MRTKLLYFLIFPFCGALNAQTYIPMQVSAGYNADVIANGSGSASASTSVGLDNANFCLLSADFQSSTSSPLPTYALPVSGLIASPITSGLTYQMAPFSGNNSARIADQSASVTLAFTTQTSASVLYFLTTSGSGITEISGNITFTDNSAQIFTASIPDWFFSTTLPVVISGIGRVGRNDNTIENPAGNPRLFQLEVAITTANQTKIVSSVQLTKTSAVEGAMNVFAISAKLPALEISDNAISKFSLLPNPFSNTLIVSGVNTVNEIAIYNMLGQAVLRKTQVEISTEINTETLPSGNYIAKLHSGEKVQTFHLIKR